MKHLKVLFIILLISQSLLGYIIDEPKAKYENGVIEWWYNPQDSPFSEQKALDFINKAIKSWENVSGITFIYKGITNANEQNLNDGKIVFGWSTHNTIIYSDKCIGGVGKFRYNGDNIITDAYLTLNRDRTTKNKYCNISPIKSWQGLTTHEVGHVLTLRHSQNCNSVMAGPPYCKYQNTPEQEILKLDDIKGIQSLYPIINLPKVTSVSPTTVQLNKKTVFTVRGKNLPSSTAFYIPECKNVKSLGGRSTYRKFSCTPSYSTGNKHGVVKDRPGGKVLKNFTVKVTDKNLPKVTSVSPTTVQLNKKTVFTVRGKNLPSSTAFYIPECKNVKSLGGRSTYRKFSCTPSYSTGNKHGVVKDRPGGKVLKNFTVKVTDKNLPKVTSVSPTTVQLNKKTVFTVRGKNLPSSTAFYIPECKNVKSLGGRSTYRKFSCTPSYSTGNKHGVVKDRPGGKVLKNFTVKVTDKNLPKVTSVSPTTVQLNKKTVFTVRGKNLPSSTAFYIPECKNVKSLGGRSTYRKFSCTPSYSTGNKHGVVKDRPGGKVLKNFTVKVTDKNLPKVTSVSPTTVQLNKKTVFTVRGKNLPSSTAFYIPECKNVKSLGGRSTYRKFSCTPSYSTGNKHGVVKDRPGGKVLKNFTVKVTDKNLPKVTSVSPTTVQLNKKTVFTVRGKNLPSSTAFYIPECKNVKSLGGRSTYRKFSCTPSYSTGNKHGVVKDRPGGKVLKNFTVKVTDKNLPKVTSVSPTTVQLNKKTVFTVRGKNLPSSTAFYIPECKNVKSLGGRSTYRKFSCTPSYSTGNKHGVVKDRPGGKVLKNFTVKVTDKNLPKVTSVSPTTVQLNKKTVFTVRGKNLPSSTAFYIPECKNVKSLGGRSTYRKFSCTPSYSTGNKHGVVKDRPGGKVLKNFTVKVTDKNLPKVTSVSPTTVQLNKKTVFTVRGKNLPSSTAFYIPECKNVKSLGGRSTYRKFSCTPSYSTGNKHGVVKDRPGGKVLKNFTVKVTDKNLPKVTSVSPTTVQLNKKTVFTVRGKNLPSSTAFYIPECKNVKSLGGRSTYRKFSCTPSYSTGNKHGVVKDRPGGKVLKNFTVKVTDKNLPKVTSVSPTTVQLNKKTVFTVRGKNLPSSTAFYIPECKNVKSLGGRSTYRKFSCTPSYSTGNKHGVVKDRPGGKVLKNFTVKVTDKNLPKVTSVSPTTVQLNKKTVFTVRGKNLPSSTAFYIPECKNVKSLGGRSTYRKFSCTPSYSTGNKHGVVKDRPGGKVLKNFTVKVTDKNLPKVTSVSPTTVQLNKKTVFTVRGKNLPSSTAFYIPECKNVKSLGGRSTYRKFSCTPSYSTGNKHGVVKDRPGGKVLKNFTVKVTDKNLPKVTSVSPTTVQLNKKTVFTVRGKNLPSSTAFYIPECKNVKSLGGRSTYRKFSCTPSYSTGNKHGVVKDRPGGKVLKNFTVKVTDKNLPKVTTVKVINNQPKIELFSKPIYTNNSTIQFRISSEEKGILVVNGEKTNIILGKTPQIKKVELKADKEIYKLQIDVNGRLSNTVSFKLYKNIEDIIIYDEKLSLKTKYGSNAGKYVLYYRIDIDKTRRFIIDMEADFDTYLSITDMSLKRLYQDDNGGSGTNSKLDGIVLEAGSYYIEATTAQKNVKGEFTLSILSEES